jgi:hypothetical protein
VEREERGEDRAFCLRAARVLASQRSSSHAGGAPEGGAPDDPEETMKSSRPDTLFLVRRNLGKVLVALLVINQVLLFLHQRRPDNGAPDPFMESF